MLGKWMLMCVAMAGTAAAFATGAEEAAAPKAASPAPAKPPRAITLDGNPIQPRPVVVAGLPVDSLFRIDEDILFDAGEQTLRLESADEGRRLMRIDEAGQRRLVALTLDRDSETFLRGLSNAELAGLRRVQVFRWSKPIADALAKLSPDCVVSVTPGARVGTPSALPTLPAQLRYVFLSGSVRPGVKDFSALRRLTDLRCLSLNGIDGDFDVAWIAEAANLRHLALSLPGELRSVDKLAQMRKLTALDLSGFDQLTSLAFLAELSELRVLDISNTGVEDLSPLAGAAKLETVNASGLEISRLPSQPTPTLKTLTALSSKLTPEAAAKFRQLNPNCQLNWSWTESLREALAGSQAVRIRQGGTCHRRGNEKELFLERDAKSIGELVTAIAVEEGESGFECMCCGEPSLEFLRDGQVVLTLGMHHGRSLRWDRGRWPGDALLTSESAEKVCLWLAARKIEGPLSDYQENLRRQQAAKRREAAIRAILPEQTLAKLKEARSEEAAIAAFSETLPDATVRCTAVLRVYGIAETSWDTYTNFEMFLHQKLLPKQPSDKLAAAAATAGQAGSAGREPTLAELQALRGSARWAFGDAKLATLSAEQRAAILPGVGAFALADPRPFNRQRALQAIKADTSDASTQLLRLLLAGKIAPRKLPADDADDAGGTREFRPDDPDRSEPSDDRVLAAVILAERRDRDSSADMKALLEAGKLSQKDRAALEKAIAQLK